MNTKKKSVEAIEWRQYSSKEVADLSGLPLATLQFFLAQAVLHPSMKCSPGRGHRHRFSFTDVLAASSLHSIRLTNAGELPISRLVSFWSSARGKRLAKRLVQEKSTTPVLLCVTHRAVAVDTPPALVMQRDGTSVVFCVDARALVQRLEESLHG